MTSPPREPRDREFWITIRLVAILLFILMLVLTCVGLLPTEFWTNRPLP